MGVGKYNIEHDDDEDYEYVSLWSHSRPFRWLVYLAVLLLVAVVYGFYAFHQTMITSNTHPQGSQATASNQAPTQNPTMPTHQITPTQNQTALTNNQTVPTTKAPPPSAHALPLQDSLENYPLATDWIASKLNPHRTAPTTGFDAYYFNSEDPNYTIIHKENRNDIHIDYAYDEFHQIPSQNFGGYWVGKIIVPQDGSYELLGDTSWSETRVLLNGRVIGEGKNRFPSANIYLKKGEYTLEVEHLNNWHTTEMYAKFKIAVQSYNKDSELRGVIAGLNLPTNTELYLVAVSDSDAPNKTINVTSNAPDPYVLMLSSSSTVSWQIYGTPPRAIIYNTNGTVASVGLPPTLKSDILIDEGLFNPKPQCSCHRGMFHCDTTSDINEVITHLRGWTGLTLVGGTGSYRATTLNLPNTYLNANFIQTYDNEYNRQRQECVAPHLTQGSITTQ